MSNRKLEYRIAAISVEYLPVRVIARVNGVIVDPTADAVEFGFTDIHVLDPEPESWYAGDWETAGTRYIARVLIGAGTDVDFLETGSTYNVWIKIHDNPETPASLFGELFIY